VKKAIVPPFKSEREFTRWVIQHAEAEGWTCAHFGNTIKFVRKADGSSVPILDKDALASTSCSCAASARRRAEARTEQTDCHTDRLARGPRRRRRRNPRLERPSDRRDRRDAPGEDRRNEWRGQLAADGDVDHRSRSQD
jgi:hypothetical protein